MKQAVVIDIRRNIPRTWEECLSRFLAVRRREGAAERTLLGYKQIVTLLFTRYPAAWGATAVDCLDEFLSQPGISPATHNNRLKVLRPFFEFAAREGAFNESPAAAFRYRRGETPRVVDHPLEDIKKILSVIGIDTFTRLRDTTLLLFSLDSGIRPSEALALYPNDIDTHLRRAAIRASVAKTRQPRTVFFSQPTAALLDRLLEVRPWDGSVPVFCTSSGEEWNTHAWSVQLRRYAEKAGLKRFSAYDLRHQFALQALRNGMDVFSLQRSMGHSTLSMTEKYLALADDDIQAAHEKASPVKDLFPAPKKRLGKI
ncbi:MAG: tyrosine-type recombinase/integrase [Aminivibrio sp.]|jgi:integrase/recombinase XerD